eukprot:CAMPEP_0206827422 /NCGR_PEP_ID=MMETSP0975-20121206/15343_1 /ASSEMBLY_ACC=CAM_ASM_000399 /TAXON_ID=483370 /ORGANISM="non described non described, Strain CCMP2097" /LENGTH=59 /DNA_ID=CAMNT_0054369731 /DNA_START=349 /DNA_END=528 /DNA_ORIENTATION=-
MVGLRVHGNAHDVRDVRHNDAHSTAVAAGGESRVKPRREDGHNCAPLGRVGNSGRDLHE